MPRGSPSDGGSRSRVRAVVRPPPRRRRRGARWPCRSRRGGPGRPARAAARAASRSGRRGSRGRARGRGRGQRRTPPGAGRQRASAGSPRWAGPPATIRITGSPSCAAGRARPRGSPARRHARRTRGPRVRPRTGPARRPRPRRGTRRARTRPGSPRKLVCKQREVELEPARLRHDVERPAREDVQCRRLAGPDLAEQAVVRVAVHADAGRHHGTSASMLQTWQFWHRFQRCYLAPETLW